MAMLPTLRYDSANDISLRLHQTFVKYDDRFVYVDQTRSHGTTGDLHVDLFDPDAGDWIDNVHTSDDRLSLAPITLGYFNYSSQALYAMRAPARKQQQGLCSANTYYIAGEGKPQAIGKGMMQTRSFVNMVKDKFPTFEEAFEFVQKGNAHSSHFGRKVAVVKDEIGLLKLHYFNKPIGWYNDKEKIFRLGEAFGHYLPILQARKVPVRLNDES